ncbi:MAG: thiamine phosphate synthase [Vicinamibacterales bacterium]|nr:thiamine phosphate synthase [Vicinamibacterales bacterium]
MVLPRLYAIVDVEACARAALAPHDTARRFLDAGVQLLQLRAKTLEGGAFLDLARRIQADVAQASAMLIINDRADIAALAGAAGVHVGQDDLSAADARAVIGPHALVGVSTHTDVQVAAALESRLSYLAVGPTFGTATKNTGYSAVGLTMVAKAAAQAAPHGVPVVAIGGITLETAASVIEAGAASVAVISDLLDGGDPVRRAKAFLSALR